MNALKNIVFVNDQMSATVSETFFNSKGESIVIELTGSVGGCIANFEGCADLDSDNFINIAGINLSDMTLVTTGMTKNGLYEFPLEGVQKFRVNLVRSDGPIKIFGRTMIAG